MAESRKKRASRLAILAEDVQNSVSVEGLRLVIFQESAQDSASRCQ